MNSENISKENATEDRNNVKSRVAHIRNLYRGNERLPKKEIIPLVKRVFTPVKRKALELEIENGMRKKERKEAEIETDFRVLRVGQNFIAGGQDEKQLDGGGAAASEPGLCKINSKLISTCYSNEGAEGLQQGGVDGGQQHLGGGAQVWQHGGVHTGTSLSPAQTRGGSWPHITAVSGDCATLSGYTADRMGGNSSVGK